MIPDVNRIASASAKYPKPSPDFRPAYGTAGFRCNASLLGSTMFRCGLLTAVRAAVLGRHCGLMITASHNPEADNGVKIVEPSGEMLPQAWEPLATELAGCSSDDEVARLIISLLQSESNLASPANPARDTALGSLAVLVGCDTRPSSPVLTQAACEGIQAMGVRAVQLGQVTTPQLHFQVAALNAGHLSLPPEQQLQAAGQGASRSAISLDLYFGTLLPAFEELCQGPKGAPSTQAPPSPTFPLYVDCANGVGAQHLACVAATLASATTGLHLHLLNRGGTPQEGGGQLNHLCGADFVQKECKAPSGFSSLPVSARCCSIDGDADRLVYFVVQQQSEQQSASSNPVTTPPSHVSLLDGDRIAALFASFVSDLLKGLPQPLAQTIKVGVVQTAYANGASTRYITQTLGLQVVCAKTGVKHLHPEAHAFDIGVYFEANGHGTALFSPSLIQQLEQIQHSCVAARQLLLLSRVINQTVGDAFSGILAVEAILRLKGWGISDWQAMYRDLPSKQTKVSVKDRTVIKTADAERVAVSPPQLQPAIDKLVAEAGDQARAFVRPSGTEDIVRVYAEVQTAEAAEALAAAVAQATCSLAA
uniref:Phosphoacetylglucosamine mutase n=1 Tax=Dunaliella tertiolecta TaxID=3047 RepID=A0A7S3R0L6_DUNTE